MQQFKQVFWKTQASMEIFNLWIPGYLTIILIRIGLRNKGMSADFLSVTYSSNNVGTGTSYKGVFLSQRPEVEGIYYSVRAPLTHNNLNGYTGYFQNWSVSGAQLSQPNPNP